MKQEIKKYQKEKKIKQVINLTKKDLPYFDEVKEELKNGVKQQVKLIDNGK